MTPITDVSRAYRPLNGEDVIEAILMELRTALRNSGMFPLHRVWHEFEFQGGVRVKGWATKTEEAKFAGGDEVSGQAPLGDLVSIDGKVAASLRDEPPSVTRERIAEANRQIAAIDPTAAMIKSGFEEPPRAKTDRHVPFDFPATNVAPMVFTCGKCGRESPTKAGKVAHERHCKVEPNGFSEPLSTPA